MRPSSGRLFMVVLRIVAIFAAFASRASAATPSLDDPQAGKLAWRAGSETLRYSHAQLNVPSGSRATRDVAAFEAIYGHTELAGTGEAIVRVPSVGTVRYGFRDRGYAAAAGWFIDAPAWLQSVRTAEIHTQNGFSNRGDGWAAQTMAWERPPTYDDSQHLVTWMSRGVDRGGRQVFWAQALVFMRRGHEVISATTDAGDADSTWQELGSALAAFAIPEGTRYRDVRGGDRADHFNIQTEAMIDSGAMAEPRPPPPPKQIFGIDPFAVFYLSVLAFIVYLIARYALRRGLVRELAKVAHTEKIERLGARAAAVQRPKFSLRRPRGPQRADGSGFAGAPAADPSDGGEPVPDWWKKPPRRR